MTNECCEDKQKIPDCASSQHSKYETLNKEIEDIMKRIDSMIRGHVFKSPNKPSWVINQKVVYNYGIAKLLVRLADGFKDGQIAQIYRSYGKKINKKQLEWFEDTINLNQVEDWEEIKRIIDFEYAPLLGWISHKDALAKLEKKPIEKTVKELVDKRPKLAIEFLKNIDLNKFDFKLISIFLEELSKRDRDVIDHDMKLFNEILNNLDPDDKRTIDDFVEVLDRISFHGINSTMNFLLDRLEKIKIFQKMVTKDKTYEIRGKNSIHRFLEKHIWILNEDYMLLGTNETFKSDIGDGYNKKHRKSKSAKRPDFVLRKSKTGELVIAEIKRPKHTVDIKDFNQIMEYRGIADGVTKDRITYHGYLIGKKFHKDLKIYNADMPKMGIHLKSYSDIITEVRDHYKKLLEIVEEELKE